MSLTLVDKDVYEGILVERVNRRKGMVFAGVSVCDEEFSELETASSLVLSYNKNVENHSIDYEVGGLLLEREVVSDTEQRSVVDYGSGTFEEVFVDGSKVLHSVKDVYDIVENDKNLLVGGNKLSKVDGYYRIEVDGGIKIKSGNSEITVESDGSVKINTEDGKFLATQELANWCKNHQHIGNMGAPTLPNPPDLSSITAGMVIGGGYLTNSVNKNIKVGV